MLKAIEETLAQKAGNGELIPPDLGEVMAIKILRTSTEITRFFELSTWVKACWHLPTYRKLGELVRSRNIFAVEGFNAYK